MFRSALAVCAALAIGVVAFASGPAARTDNRVACLDLQSGRLLWRFDAEGYGTPTLELHEKAHLVVRRREDSSALVLNAGSGDVLRDVKTPAAEAAQAVAPRLSEVSRPLRLHFKVLNRREYRKDKTVPLQREVRELARKDDPEAPFWRISGDAGVGGLIVVGDVLIAAEAFPGNRPGKPNAVLRGYLSGNEKPTWTVDLNERWPQVENAEFFRVSIGAVEGRLIAQAWGHLFAFAPKTGEVLWHADLADHGMLCEKQLPFAANEEYDRWLWHGGVPIASISGADGVVLAGYESRLVALDGASGKLRWNIRTATTHLQRPVVANGVIFTWVGDAYREVEDLYEGDAK